MCWFVNSISVDRSTATLVDDVNVIVHLAAIVRANGQPAEAAEDLVRAVASERAKVAQADRELTGDMTKERGLG